MSKEENKTVEAINEEERVIEQEIIEKTEIEPVLRGGGLRGVADPNMIQTHIDNFLAMLCGETPVDSNVRTSAEYWLKRLAEGEGGSTKKIYAHTVRITRSGAGVGYISGYTVILSASSESLTSDYVTELLQTPGSIILFYEGRTSFPSSGTGWTDSPNIAVYLKYNTDSNFMLGYIDTVTGDMVESTGGYSAGSITLNDLSITAIN